MSLWGAGLVSADDLEQLIDRALAQLDGRIGIDELRMLLQGAGIGEDGQGDENATVH